MCLTTRRMLSVCTAVHIAKSYRKLLIFMNYVFVFFSKTFCIDGSELLRVAVSACAPHY